MTIKKDETKLKAKLTEDLRKNMPQFVIERHEDKITHGIPDYCITGNKVCTRFEVKHATPDFESKGIQELTMLRLAKAGFAWYIVYWEDDTHKFTYIVEPHAIGNSPESWSRRTEGFDNKWIEQFIRKVHNDNRLGS